MGWQKPEDVLLRIGDLVLVSANNEEIEVGRVIIRVNDGEYTYDLDNLDFIIPIPSQPDRTEETFDQYFDDLPHNPSYDMEDQS